MAPIRDVLLGRLRLPTIIDGITESLGDSVEVVGGAITPGERRARPFPLKIRVAGSGDSDLYTAGQRLRRQARALLDNQALMSQGIFMQLTFDAEQNGWLILSGADLDYDKGGITFGDYTLQLRDAYRAAAPRSHRPARRLQITNLTSGAAARDYLGKLYSTDFASVVFTGSTPADHEPRYWLPAGVTDVLVDGRLPLPNSLPAAVLVDGTNVRTTAALPSLSGVGVSYELADALLARNVSDVAVYDRRGSASLPGPTDDPELSSGWEEVFGPSHDLYQPTTDVPVLQNGICRVRLVGQGTAAEALHVDRFIGTSWVDQGACVVNRNSGALGRSWIAEVTPERAVIAFTVTSLAQGRRGQVFVTLQRGWTGPRVEMYFVDAVDDILRWVPSTTGTVTVAYGGGTPPTNFDSAHGTWDDVSRGTYSAGGRLPYAGLQSSTPTAGDPLPRTVIMLQQAATALVTVIDTDVYAGTRYGVELRKVGGEIGYQSMQIGFADDDGSTWAHARDLARSHLFDVRAVPEVISR